MNQITLLPTWNTLQGRPSWTNNIDGRVTTLESAVAALGVLTTNQAADIANLQIDISTINSNITALDENKVPYSGATQDIDLDTNSITNINILSTNTLQILDITNQSFSTVTVDDGLMYLDGYRIALWQDVGTTYIPYTGATKNANLGIYTLTAGGLSTSGNITIGATTVIDSSRNITGAAISSSGNITVGTSGPQLVGNIAGTGRLTVRGNLGNNLAHFGQDGSYGVSVRHLSLNANPSVAASDVYMSNPGSGGVRFGTTSGNRNAAVYAGSFDASGTVSAAGGYQFQSTATGSTITLHGGHILFKSNDIYSAKMIGGTEFRMPTAMSLTWTDGTSYSGSVTSTLSQASAGVLQVGTNGNNANGQLNLANLVASGNISVSGTISGDSSLPTLNLSNAVGSTLAFNGGNYVRVGNGNITIASGNTIVSTFNSSTGLTVTGDLTISGTVRQGITSLVSDPSPGVDLASGKGGWFKNTTTGNIKFQFNDGGTLKSSAALT